MWVTQQNYKNRKVGHPAQIHSHSQQKFQYESQLHIYITFRVFSQNCLQSKIVFSQKTDYSCQTRAELKYRNIQDKMLVWPSVQALDMSLSRRPWIKVEPRDKIFLKQTETEMADQRSLVGSRGDMIKELLQIRPTLPFVCTILIAS